MTHATIQEAVEEALGIARVANHQVFVTHAPGHDRWATFRDRHGKPASYYATPEGKVFYCSANDYAMRLKRAKDEYVKPKH